jgi:CheY-like chemotaxis protein
MLQQKVLIISVDPDSCSAEARRLLLEESGYQVLIARNVRDGLELFAQQAIDIALVDYEMPFMNGGLVAARMKGTKPSVPVMVFAANDHLAKDKLSSADAFVTEGEPWSMVLAKIDELVRLSAPFFSRWLEDWKHRGDLTLETRPERCHSSEDSGKTIH